MGIRIWDCGLGLRLGIGLGIGNLDEDLRLGIEHWDWGFVIGIRDRGLQFGIGDRYGI